jgi:hypothetical protein
MVMEIQISNIRFTVDARDVGEDGGVSIKVLSNVGNKEAQLLRFDVFRQRPHYHYDPEGHGAEYNLDPLLIEDGLGWMLAQLRAKFPEMVTHAGFGDVAEEMDLSAILPIIDDIEREARVIEAEGIKAAAM